MSSPLPGDLSTLLNEKEHHDLKSKLLLSELKTQEKSWQLEARSLAISFVYYEPASYLAKKLGKKPRLKEVFWLLIFLFMWQEKGHTTLDLRQWPSWVELCLKDQENLCLYEKKSPEFLQNFTLISKWIKRKIANLPQLKTLLRTNNDLFSSIYNKYLSPFIWDEKNENLGFSKLLKKEENFLRIFLKILKRKKNENLDLSQKEKVLIDLKNHIYPFQLSEEQLSLIDKALLKSLLIVSGGPGTGKTSTVINLLRVYIALWNAPYAPRIALCAPTGLASRRLKDSLSHALTKPFYWQGKAIDELINQEEPFVLQGLLGVSPFKRSSFNHENPLFYDLVIVDESSMVNTELMQNLLEALGPKSTLILIGDPHQLAPVEWGSPFCDLFLLAQKFPQLLGEHWVSLSVNYRFGDQAILTQLAEKVLKKESEEFLNLLENLSSEQKVVFSMPKKPYQLIDELYKQYILGKNSERDLENELLKFSPQKILDNFATENFGLLEILKRSLILTSHNLGKWGVDKLNSYLLAEHQKNIKKYLPKTSYMPLWGVPLMVTRNRPDLQVFNGQRGFIFYPCGDAHLAYAYFWQSGSWRNFPLTHLGTDYTLSFCATVHKSQGGEYEHITLILAEKNAVLSQELLYTALTRAKKSIDIYSSREILKHACNFSSSRLSYLNTSWINFVIKQ